VCVCACVCVGGCGCVGACVRVCVKGNSTTFNLLSVPVGAVSRYSCV